MKQDVGDVCQAGPNGKMIDDWLEMSHRYGVLTIWSAFLMELCSFE